MWILFAILGVIVVGLLVTLVAFEPGRREALNISIDDVRFDGLKDGVYLGEYKGKKDSLRDSAVGVTVADGAVAKIKVIKGTLAGEKQSAEVRNGQSINDLFERVIEEQTLQVDIISGATISCKVHLKAIENALDKARK